MITFGTGFIIVELSWNDFKSIIVSKKLLVQFTQEANTSVPDGMYKIFALDDSLVYITNIFCGTIPSVADIDQQTNDNNKIEFEATYKNISNKRLSPSTQGNDSALKVSPVGRDGSEIVWATHNFCDKTSWYGEALRRSEVQLTSSDGGFTFYESGSIKPWIDMYNGKTLHEDNIRAASNGYYDIEIVASQTTKSMNDCIVPGCSACSGDYTVNFNSGSVIFNSQITGSVYATFCEPNSAWWTLQPRQGTRLSVEGAEMQFSEDVDLRDNIVMQIRGYVQVFAPQYWQGNGGPLPTNYKIVLGEYQYKSLGEFVDETEGAYPVVPAIGGPSRGLKSAMYGLPFAYKTIRELIPEYGMEIRVGLKHDHEFGGFRATATFYCVEKEA